MSRFKYNVGKNCIEFDGEFIGAINDGDTIVKKLNELYSDKKRLVGHLLKYRGLNDDDIDYVLSLKSNEYYGEKYCKKYQEVE